MAKTLLALVFVALFVAAATGKKDKGNKSDADDYDYSDDEAEESCNVKEPDTTKLVEKCLAKRCKQFAPPKSGKQKKKKNKSKGSEEEEEEVEVVEGDGAPANGTATATLTPLEQCYDAEADHCEKVAEMRVCKADCKWILCG